MALYTASVKLYVALVDLEIRSAVASWPAPAGSVFPQNENSPATAFSLAQGWIRLAPDGSVDNTTPRGIIRGQPGLHVGVSN